MTNRIYAALAGAICLLGAGGASADQPVDWQMGFQAAATPIMEEIRWFEQYTLWFIVPVTLLVLVLLVIVGVKFRASKNPVPSKTSHNTAIEVVWTLAPVLILVFLAFPSFNLLNAQLRIPQDHDLTIKATATQWLWSYEYDAADGEEVLSFDSYMLKEDDRAEYGKEDMAIYPRLLAVDNEMVVPVDKVVRLLVTAAPTDVIHSFAMPAFGVKMDAIPGRLNETWFKATREGLFYGQCSELCGKDHAYMPIAIRVVSEEKYKEWLAGAETDINSANRALMASANSAERSIELAETN